MRLQAGIVMSTAEEALNRVAEVEDTVKHIEHEMLSKRMMLRS